MRLLRINGHKVDIDDNTAIGITYQGYDVKTPGQRKVNVTNTFTIPATSHNLNIFGNANNPQSISKKIYQQNTLDYWVDNQQMIKDSGVRVNSISDRISLFAFEKPDVWEQTKKVLWSDFVDDFVKWMQDEKGLPSLDNPSTDSFQDFIEPYTTSTTGIKLPLFFGNLYNYDPDGGELFLEDPNSIYLRYWPVGKDKADGGHFCVYCKTIFEYIEWKYDVNFLTSGSGKNGNVWDDDIAKSLYIPVRDIGVRILYSGSSITGYYFEQNTDPNFLPLKNQKDKTGKKLYDFINAFFQHLNIIIDEFSNDNIIRLARFDDIGEKAEVIDWSGRFSGKPEFIPFINGFKQENYIKFKEKYEEADDFVNSKTITCLNENIDASGDLFEIDAYVPSFLEINGGVVPDMSTKESFKTFTFLIDSGETSEFINIYNNDDGFELNASFKLQKSALYSLDSEYTLIDSIAKYPRVYNTERWLNINDIHNIEFFRLYWSRELNGSYFLNKISGYNPQKSNAPTKLELIYINDRTPITPPTLDYWVDGVADAWTDGINDIWY